MTGAWIFACALVVGYLFLWGMPSFLRPLTPAQRKALAENVVFHKEHAQSAATAAREARVQLGQWERKLQLRRWELLARLEAWRSPEGWDSLARSVVQLEKAQAMHLDSIAKLDAAGAEHQRLAQQAQDRLDGWLACLLRTLSGRKQNA